MGVSGGLQQEGKERSPQPGPQQPQVAVRRNVKEQLSVLFSLLSHDHSLSVTVETGRGQEGTRRAVQKPCRRKEGERAGAYQEATLGYSLLYPSGSKPPWRHCFWTV